MTRSLFLSAAVSLLATSAHAVTLWSEPMAAEPPYGFRWPPCPSNGRNDVPPV